MEAPLGKFSDRVDKTADIIRGRKKDETSETKG